MGSGLSPPGYRTCSAHKQKAPNPIGGLFSELFSVPSVLCLLSVSSVLILSFFLSFFLFLPYLTTSCLSQCTASSAPQSASRASFVVFRISSSSPLACSSSHPRQAARCALSASSCTSKYASPSGCVTPYNFFNPSIF